MSPDKPVGAPTWPLAVVVPFFNEEQVIESFYAQLTRVLDAWNPRYLMVFVDDGSKDATLSILNKIADRDARVSVLSLSRNRGHQNALAAGIDHADADAVVVMDGDLQHPPAMIPEMFTRFASGSDVVYAVRKNAAGTSLAKRVVSNWFYALFQRYTDIVVIRGSADFRLTSRRVVQALRGLRETHRYLRGMVPWLGFPSSVVYYDQADRQAGVPSYTWRQSLRLARDAMFSLSTLPLEMLSWIAGTLAVVAGVYLLYVLSVWLSGSSVVGWTSVIAVQLVVATVQLLASAVSAKYLGMIFEESKRRPLYVLKQRRMVGETEWSGGKGDGQDTSE